MKTVRKLLVGAILAGFLGGAQALPLTLTDPITLSPTGQTVSNNLFATLNVDLNTFGYNSTLHLLETAFLSLAFTVSTNGNPNASVLTVELSGQSPATFSAGNTVGNVNSGSLAQFLALGPIDDSGLLEFTIFRSNNSGTVTLSQASLTLTGSLRDVGAPPGPVNPGETGNSALAVPEPGTLALLGLGLLGGVFARRREA